MDRYKVVGPDTLADPISDFFLKNNNSQIYMSAAASRYLGNPESVAILMSKDEKSIAIASASSIPSGTEYIDIKTLRREDSDACRLSGVPRYIMMRLSGKIQATATDIGLVEFPLGE